MPAASQSGEPDAYHIPVMLEEVLSFLNPAPGETVLDATVGGGSHSDAIAEKLAPGGRLVALDRDEEALAAAEITLDRHTQITKTLVHTGFGDLNAALAALEGGEMIRFDGALFDLGVSSHQLDTARGFSFRRDEALDMRMDRSGGALRSAADLLAELDEQELARILWEFGDERWSRAIARRVVQTRASGVKIETTLQLAALIEQSIPRSAWPREIHVATRSFQALRIAVNDEIGQLRAGLQAAMDRLEPQGRLVVLSYHSLEDRIVKQMFAEWAGRAPSAPGSSPAALMPQDLSAPIASLLTRKPAGATAAEIQRNPRARSAKLRAIVRRTDTRG